MLENFTNRLRTWFVLTLGSFIAAGSVTAAPVTYDFSLDVGGTSVSGFFVIDGSNANYTGGGTTNQDALLDYSVVFQRGATTFTGTPSNVFFVQTFDITYAADLLSVTGWDISLDFSPASAAFAGNNVSGGGFAQVAGDGLDGFANRAPAFTATLRDDPVGVVPEPASLALVALGLACLRLGRRRGAAATA